MKNADQWFDDMMREDPPGWDDDGERHSRRRDADFEEVEVEEEEEHISYDRRYSKARARR